jgi:hypothetical protein
MEEVNLKTQKRIRYIVLFSGIGLYYGVIIAGVIINALGFWRKGGDLDSFNFIGSFFIGIWVILPYLFYFPITEKMQSLIRIITPAILLLLIHLGLIIAFLTGGQIGGLSGLIGLMVVALPIYGGVALAIEFPLGIGIEKIKNKLVETKK